MAAIDTTLVQPHTSFGSGSRFEREGTHPSAALDRRHYAALVTGDDLRFSEERVDLSVVVVTHESANEIAACLGSLRAVADEVRFEVIVVDNASTDGTEALIRDEFPEVRLIRKARRHGFAVNCNIGAVAGRGRYLLLLNPDTVTHPGALAALVRYLDGHPEVGAVGPRLVYPDGTIQPSARRFPELRSALVRRTPLRLLFPSSAVERHHLGLDQLAVDVPRDADWLLGAAIVLRRTAFDELGGLDDAYRLYCEDIDLCWRLHQRGWAVRLLPAAVIQHDLDELTRKRLFTVRTWWHMRSMARFLHTHGLGRPVATTSVDPALA